MTILGKILVIVNLVFSIIVGAFIIMAYVSRTNWADAYKKLEDKAKVATANANTYAEEAEAARKEGRDKAAKLEEQLTATEGELKKEKDAHEDTKKKAAGLTGEVTLGGTNVTSITEEIKRRQEEVKGLEKQLQGSLEENQKVVKEKNDLRDRATAAEIEANSVRARNTALVAQIEEFSKQLVKMRANGGSTTTTVAARNPPLANVEGLVKGTDPSGLLTLTIGSDAGLVEGNTMEVFSLNPARYKGTVRIISVRPNEAVAKPVAKPIGTIQVGDTVASKILGG